MSRACTWMFVLVPMLVLPCCAKFGAAEDDNTPSTTPDAADGHAPSDAPGKGDAPGSDDANVEDGRGSDGPVPDGSVPCNAACKGTAMPCGLPITTAGKTFCIDPTEVTVDAYEKFLQLFVNTSVMVDEPCGNTTIVRRVNRGPGMPVSNVTWCEARAYCKWAGKRLCGTIDGKAVTATEDATQSSAWYHACTAGGGNHTLIGATQCRLANNVGPLPSGTTCQGGYSGLYDMPGNVWEWIDYHTGGNAFFVGNGYSQPSVGNTCATESNTPITNPREDVGFRCCSY